MNHSQKTADLTANGKSIIGYKEQNKMPRPLCFHRLSTERWYCFMQTAAVLQTKWKRRALWYVCLCMCVRERLWLSKKCRQQEEEVHSCDFVYKCICLCVHLCIKERFVRQPDLHWRDGMLSFQTLVQLALCNPDDMADSHRKTYTVE